MTPVDFPEGVRRGRIEPLWTRVDRNRVRFALFIAGYLASIAASAAVLAAVAAALLGIVLMRAPYAMVGYYSHLDTVAVAAAAIALVAGSAWVAWAMLRSEKRLLRRLGAELTPKGEYLTSKLALKDMAIAAGFQHAPPLWVIPDCGRVNAFAVGRTPRTSVIGVTQGFADRLGAEDQRAVFANLMARLANGDVRWATAVSALVGPLWQLREHDLRRADKALRVQEARDYDTPDGEVTVGGEGSGAVVLYFVLYLLVVVVSEVLMSGHQRSTLLAAEKADAEGMLLLKDPREMLRALGKVLEANNTVPSAGDAHSALFYCWAGFGFAPEDDPEFERLARLREVLGAEGLAVPAAYAPPATADEMLAPHAPRVRDEEEL